MKVVQFFALPTGPYQPPGEHQFEVLEDGSVYERYVYTNQPPGLWVPLPPPPKSDSPKRLERQKR